MLILFDHGTPAPLQSLLKGHAILDTLASHPISSKEIEPCCRWSRRLAMSERSQDRIKHQVQFLAHILGKEAQHQIAVLL